ncbi:MAG: hypothetical protein H0U18_12500 [Pyrinomonadaceae bacterium]|nr:hypothetical protein [Pyrinomonadaceae bacterium]
MLFSVVLSIAPFRSFLDPNYSGLGLGFLRLEGIAATLPATLIFGWAVASAWLAVSKGRGRWMTLIVVGDIFLAVNFGGSTLLEGSSDNWRIDFGAGRFITGLASAFILLLFFTFPFVASAIWAASRSRSNGTAPPLTSDLQEKGSDTEDHTKDISSFRLSESRV